jgi:hypothetical protein
VGNPIFNATVQTFIDLGVNPNVTCIENLLWSNPSAFALGVTSKVQTATAMHTTQPIGGLQWRRQYSFQCERAR